MTLPAKAAERKPYNAFSSIKYAVSPLSSANVLGSSMMVGSTTCAKRNAVDMSRPYARILPFAARARTILRASTEAVLELNPKSSVDGLA